MVTQIVDLIFEDDVFSHSERLAVRYLFESSEVTFASTARRIYLSKFESVEKDPSSLIFGQILRALYKKVSLKVMLHSAFDRPDLRFSV